MDRGVNVLSHRHQSKLDHSKSESARDLENSFNCALLLSVRGVTSIVVNQYASSPALLSSFSTAFFSSMASGMSVGDSLSKWRKERPPTMRSFDAFNACLYGLPSTCFSS
eukprot:TRINITY_DN12435_c0_g1_i1.p1 TRINITY_DN12435_c0_g1~~TRINITY_DN12435_c0_g1_i1.p1  ORF type:complete len:110 (-),score=12.91 TRINITY_DN12435_c0_g1_i1:58-387(-)